MTHAVVEIKLTEVDYRANEEELSIEVAVAKNISIASDIILSVSPVVSKEARQLGLFPLGVESPNNNNGRSPIDAGMYNIILYLLYHITM